MVRAPRLTMPARSTIVVLVIAVAGAAADSLFGAGRVTVANDLGSALAGARAVVLVTRWPKFASVPALLAGRPEPPVVVDGRRMLDRSSVARYDGIGLGEE